MYPGAKKVSIFSEKNLTNRIPPIQSLNTEQHNTTHIYGRIYSVNFLSHTTEAAGGIPSAAFLRLNRFSSVIPLGSLLGKIKFFKGVF